MATHFDDTSGVRVELPSVEAFIGGLAEGMIRLASPPALRATMGQAARRRIEEGPHAWERKIDRSLGIYRDTIPAYASGRRPSPGPSGAPQGSLRT